MSVPTLCLNMIVRNESKIIRRLLESIYSIIDYYCICDTGSTDNTCEIITEFMKEKNIDGRIIYEPFVNFEYSRTFALRACDDLKDTAANYLLLLDADMMLEIKPKFNKSRLLEGEIFHLLQGSPSFYYKNVRIIKNSPENKYIGVTHEYLSSPNEFKKINISKDELFIIDIGDGGSKGDKFVRDINLLKAGLEKEPTNGRYYFYLANSYKDNGDFELAIETYKKKVELPHQWFQEVWQSYYRIGHCYMKLEQPELAIKNWEKCSEIHPERIENIYQIVNYYRLKSKQGQAMDLCKKGMALIAANHNKDDYLFLENDIYEWRLYYEYTIIAYYANIRNISKEVLMCFNKTGNFSILNNILKNYLYYNNLLVAKKTHNLSSSFYYKNIYLMNSSSASILQGASENDYILNMRYVNYSINKETGQYLNCENHIITVNKQVELNSNFEIISEKILYPKWTGRRYIGIEDIKLFKYKNELYYTGTTYQEKNNIGISMGKYPEDITCGQELFQTFKKTDCEKNWVFIDYNDKLCMIYSWAPLIIGYAGGAKDNEEPIEETHPNELKIEHVITDLPNIFRHFRGSSNEFRYDGKERWFIVHLVCYDNPRIYYHVLCVFDNNMKLIKYSDIFKLSNEKIEYALGLIVKENEIIISYSDFDKTTKIGVYDKNAISWNLWA